MRQMKVDKLGIDLLTHDPVVILKDMDGSHYLPILIGPFEATAIALALEGAIFRAVRGAFDRGAREAFTRMTGAWPGDEAPKRT